MCSDDNLFGLIFCSTLNSINYYSICSKTLLYGEILSWNLLSKWYSEDGCSEVILNTSFWMGTDEIFLKSSCCFPLKSINYYSWFSKKLSDGEILACNFLSKWSSEHWCSEVILDTSFWMCFDYNMFDSMCYFKISINVINLWYALTIL